MKKDAFKLAVQKIVIAFSSLKLDTTAIKKIQKEKRFTTEEVISLLDKVDQEQENNRALDEQLKQEQEKSRVLEEELNAEPKSFCVLPSKPSHETVSRPNEVRQVMERMKTLREKKKEPSNHYLPVRKPRLWQESGGKADWRKVLQRYSRTVNR